MLLLLILSSSGCKEKENLKDRIFSIEEADMNQEFGSTPENKIILIKTNLSLNDWKAESEANWLFLSTKKMLRREQASKFCYGQHLRGA